MKWFACLAVMLLSILPAAGADLTLGTPFSSGMVLQRDVKLPVWGKAPAGTKVTVDFAGQSKTATAEESGKWMLHLDPLAVSAEGREMTVRAGDDSARLDDVLVGDVWLCAGQSNMGVALKEADGGPAEIEKANDPLLRCLKMRHVALPRHPSITTTQPARPGRGAGADAINDTEPPQPGWMSFTARDAAKYTAMSYFFGKKLRAELNVPIGLVVTAWGGSTIVAWVPRETLDRPPLKGVIPEDVGNHKIHKRPGGNFQGMVRPLVPFAAKGAIWYQGESDGEPDQNPYLHRLLMPALITSWREQFQNPQLPFYVVQLPNLERQAKWPVVREGQALAASLPNAGFIPTLDIGQVNKLHPSNKKDYADRMAALVLGEVYGKEKLHVAVVTKAEMTDGGAKVTFSDELKTSDGKPPRGFELAAADGVFKPAEATVSGSVVTVKSADVAQPAFVRYAWAGDPKANLVNVQDIPAAPYRNDSLLVDGSDMVPAGLPSKATLATTASALQIAEANGAAASAPPANVIWVSDEAIATLSDGVTFKGASPAKGATVEFHARVPDAPAAPYGMTFEVTVAARVYRLGIGKDFVASSWDKDVRMLLSGVDNHADFHTFRLAIRADGVAEVYRDGQPAGIIRGESVTAGGASIRIGRILGTGRGNVMLQSVGVDTEGAFKP